MKAWGGHHLFAAVPILAVLWRLPADISVPLAHAMAWFFKELGEATQRAGGTKQALGLWRDIKSADRQEGIWEHWDWITPGIAGVAAFKIGALIWNST